MKFAPILVLFVSLSPVPLALAAPKKLPVSLLALAGYEPLQGEGIVIALNDRSLPALKTPASIMPGLVHDFDLLALVNELRFAGAQGISVNGVRLTNQSAIRCVGPTLFVDKTALQLPIKIEAVGNSALLKSRLQVRGGLWEQMTKTGPKSQLQVVSKMRLNAAQLPATARATK